MGKNNIDLNSWPEKFKYLFDVAKETINRDILNVDEITVGYYRLITVPCKHKIVDKIAMLSAIYRYSNQNKKCLCLNKRQRHIIPLRYHSCSDLGVSTRMRCIGRNRRSLLKSSVRCSEGICSGVTLLPCTDRQLSEGEEAEHLSSSMH